MRDSEPSWQNSDESIERTGDPHLLNVDARDAGTNDFLEAAGATEIVQQFEMTKRIG